MFIDMGMYLLCHNLFICQVRSVPAWMIPKVKGVCARELYQQIQEPLSLNAWSSSCFQMRVGQTERKPQQKKMKRRTKGGKEDESKYKGRMQYIHM